MELGLRWIAFFVGLRNQEVEVTEGPIDYITTEAVSGAILERQEML